MYYELTAVVPTFIFITISGVKILNRKICPTEEEYDERICWII